MNNMTETHAEFQVSPSLIIRYMEGNHLALIDPVTNNAFVILAKEIMLFKSLLWQIATYEGAN